MTGEEDLHEPLKTSLKKRMPWLMILLFLGMGVSSVVGLFESVVSQVALIVCFQSLVLDMAGNVGTQSLAVTIRVLMDEKLTARQKFDLVLKKCASAFSAALGLLALVFIGLYVWLLKGQNAVLCPVHLRSARRGAGLHGAFQPCGHRCADVLQRFTSIRRGFRPADYHRQRFGCRHRILWAGVYPVLSGASSGVIRSVSFPQTLNPSAAARPWKGFV